MENTMTIGEVARLLNIPESTLRFWQEKGIFEVATAQNRYRTYSVANLVELAEIAFYRKMGLSVRQMRNFSRFELKDYRAILDSVKRELEEKLAHHRRMYESVLQKQVHLETIERLKGLDYEYGAIPFGCVVRFDYADSAKLLRYANDPSLYIRYQDTRAPQTEARGIIVEAPALGDELLWQARGQKRCAVFLVEEIASENYVNNVEEKLALVRERHRTGVLLAEFLVSETLAGRRIDYLQAFVELLEEGDAPCGTA